jgi:hypothetical protein
LKAKILERKKSRKSKFFRREIFSHHLDGKAHWLVNKEQLKNICIMEWPSEHGINYMVIWQCDYQEKIFESTQQSQLFCWILQNDIAKMPCV